MTRFDKEQGGSTEGPRRTWRSKSFGLGPQSLVLPALGAF